jgi:hypothetical protein
MTGALPARALGQALLIYAHPFRPIACLHREITFTAHSRTTLVACECGKVFR